MLIRVCKNTQPIPLILIIIISIITWSFSANSQFKIVETNGMPLYEIANYLVNSLPIWLVPILGFLITVSQAIHLNFILNKHEVLYKDSYLPALMFTVLAGLLPPFLWFHPILIVNTILIFALDKIFALYKNSSPFSNCFDSAFLLALAALTYLPSIVLFLVYAVSLLVLRPFSWREWTIGIMGFILPFFFAFLYYFLQNQLLDFYNGVFITGINKKLDWNHFFVLKYTTSVIIVCLLLIFSIVRLQSNYYKNVTKSRLIQQLLFILIPVGLLSVLVSRDEQLYRFEILIVPFSVYLGYFFLSTKKQWMAESIFVVLIAAWIYNFFIV